ncbi:hypothetical protein OG2516_11921 [Oceanicola granulosus HTCC2516]|uniref:DUF2125 domain-containing protein n=1 Tax=Oceanicola granulosus (strain ATCC BAA-861 / DSM 15982 / KCTC 12143 / HTCC2516) TaxID=314256 RepID=Q2CBE0_OCEGH|nr:DUF2125 domain-containing protein [Oceanicola granulosus]EAR49958.1 hypothetical protein OG2516_11921 [Oceanicola granulosus HTCC2516]
MMATLKTFGGAALAALLGSTAAFADVTAQEVWDDWKAQMEIYGDGAVTVGSETMKGETLTVEDITVRFADEEAVVTAEIGPILLTTNEDGTVSVELPGESPVTIETNPVYGEPVEMQLTFTQEAAMMTVSGDPDAMTYDLVAASYGIRVDDISDSGEVNLNAAEATLSNIEATYSSVTNGQLRNLDYDFSAESLSANVDAEEPGGPGLFKFSGAIDALRTNASIVVPVEMDMDAPESAFVDGLSFEGGYSFGSNSYVFELNEGENRETSGAVTASGGELSIAMSSAGFSFSGGATEPSLELSSYDLPFPVSVSAAEYAYGISVPLAAGDAPQPFGLSLLLDRLAIGEPLWGMIDPAASLPHDPATVRLDLTGMVNPRYDVLDPSQMPQMMSDDLPADLTELSLNDLTVSVAGAELIGSGSFTFDSSDLETFQGFPAPTGELTVRLTGANTLIDKLVEMGLLPQEPAMGARMMMGMFAKPVGDDQLETKLEITGDGQIIANGQRIQ